MIWCRLAALFVVAISCAPSGARSPGEAEPDKVVEKFYEAVDAHDCAAMRKLIHGDAAAHFDEQGCELVAKRMQENTLEEVVRVDVDGRDKNARLVRVRLSGIATELVIRLERVQGHWKIVSV